MLINEQIAAATSELCIDTVGMLARFINILSASITNQ